MGSSRNWEMERAHLELLINRPLWIISPNDTSARVINLVENGTFSLKLQVDEGRSQKKMRVGGITAVPFFRYDDVYKL